MGKVVKLSDKRSLDSATINYNKIGFYFIFITHLPIEHNTAFIITAAALRHKYLQ